MNIQHTLHAKTPQSVWVCAPPLSSHERIAQQKNAPLTVKIVRALERLRSPLTLMTTGAHPDDEPSALLAALRHHDGIGSVIYCITRGEGGQNSLGAERGVLLGALRTREMQEACRALDARLVFGGQDEHDPVHDFGFSKDPHDTLQRWNEEVVVERMVRAIRTYRPDIIINCFNNVAGQHGHHRAAVLITDKAVARAAQSAFYPEHFAEGLSAWQVAKVYDPAWSGGGDTYDDENAPPPATLTVRSPERDALTGATYPQMGEWSRCCHLTQNMGEWLKTPQSAWDLHLRTLNGSAGGQQESHIGEGLPASWQALAALVGEHEPCGKALLQVAQHLHQAEHLAPQSALLYPHALAIAKALQQAEQTLPKALYPTLGHRMARKRKEADALLALVAGIEVRCVARAVDNGAQMTIETELHAPALAKTEVTVVVRETNGFTNPMPPFFDPLGGNGEAWAQVLFELDGYQSALSVDLETAVWQLPREIVTLSPEALIYNRAAAQSTTLTINAHWHGMQGAWALPAGWTITDQHHEPPFSRTTFTPPSDVALGRVVLEPRLGEHAAWQVQSAFYPHTGRVVVPQVARVPVQIIDAQLPSSRVGYIGAGHDNVARWLRAMGVVVTEITPELMKNGAWQDLDTLVVGVFAFGKRTDLPSALPDIHAWVKNGGHLLTLYHRPSDGWHAKQTPPAFLQIGAPSIRFRVTDENAPVTHLAPHHPLLNYPNVINEQDWAGWDKERGLYLASRWDSVYVPLLAMSDKGEAPLLGALLSAEIGKGRHTHTALVLHHQLDKLTAGAFRLMANLVQKA